MLLKLKHGFLFMTFYYVLFLTLMNQGNAGDEDTDPSHPFNQIYIRYNDIKKGKELPIYFGHPFKGKIPQFLPKEKADSFPFSSEHLPLLLEYFGFQPGSKPAIAVANTLKMCEKKPKREVIYCATSLESMLNFVSKMFKGTPFKVMGTSPLPKSSKLLQNYTIVEQPRKVQTLTTVTCHSAIYPYAVYHCHHLEQENQIFEVSLRGEDGTHVDATVICHMDTSEFDPDHIAFKVMKFKAGDEPACHFNPSIDLFWVSDNVDAM